MSDDEKRLSGRDFLKTNGIVTGVLGGPIT